MGRYAKTGGSDVRIHNEKKCNESAEVSLYIERGEHTSDFKSTRETENEFCCHKKKEVEQETGKWS
jgi:hypothetical protein